MRFFEIVTDDAEETQGTDDIKPTVMTLNKAV